MSAGPAPRPDRWLVLPEALFHALAAQAWARGLLAMRLVTGQVKPVPVDALSVRTRALLGEGWAHVRLLIGDGPNGWRVALEEQLCGLADALSPPDAARAAARAGR